MEDPGRSPEESGSHGMLPEVFVSLAPHIKVEFQTSNIMDAAAPTAMLSESAFFRLV